MHQLHSRAATAEQRRTAQAHLRAPYWRNHLQPEPPLMLCCCCCATAACIPAAQAAAWGICCGASAAPNGFEYEICPPAIAPPTFGAAICGWTWFTWCKIGITLDNKSFVSPTKPPETELTKKHLPDILPCPNRPHSANRLKRSLIL